MNAFKKTFAALTAAVMLMSFAACNNNKIAEETTTAATTVEPETVEATTLPSTAEEATQTETQTEAETTTEASTATEAPVTTEAPATTKKATTTKKAVTTQKATTTKKPTTTEKKASAPSSKADIVALYNKAAAAAASSKPGYKKSTTTVLSNLDMGALAKISAVRETVGSFLGEGSTAATVSKGSFDGKSLVKSSLKESDVTSASCKLSSDGKYYELTITVKNETNPLKGSSALGRFTKDYKDVDEIKSGLSDVGASVDSLTVTTTKVTITAKINASNNRFVSLTHNIKMNAVLNNVKYSIAKVSKATASLETTVNYSDFKY